MTTPDVKKEFGAAVRAYRQQLGISQEKLAERAELHRTYVTDVERGTRNISLESIARLAQALDLSIGSLFSLPRIRSGRPDAGESDQKDVEILLVEDDPKDVELTLKAFSGARLSNKVEVVRDGAAALDFLLREGPYSHRKQIKTNCVVLLDLQLPKLHGLEVLKRLRVHEQTRGLQVVVLTESRRDADVREALRLGAVAYIVKPLDFEAFSSVTPRLNFCWSLLQPEPSSRTLPARKTDLAD